MRHVEKKEDGRNKVEWLGRYRAGNNRIILLEAVADYRGELGCWLADLSELD